MGWLVFLGFAVALLGLLAWRLRFDRGLLMLAGAAVAVAAAGYEWQGRPGLGGHAAEDAPAAKPVETAFADERALWMDRVGPDALQLDSADALIRQGESAYAVGILRGAVSRSPRSAVLWMGLGNALVHYADGAVTPAAYYAFGRAAALKPADPAPAYFLGLAEALSGNVDGAIARWRRLLQGTSGTADWRLAVARKLMLLESLRNSDGKSAP